MIDTTAFRVPNSDTTVTDPPEKPAEPAKPEPAKKAPKDDDQKEVKALKAKLGKALEILGRLVEHEGQWVEHTVNGRRAWVFHPSASQETQAALALGVKVPEHRE